MKKSIGKKLLIVLGSLVAVVAIVAASVYGTIAYLTSSAAVSNVFTIGEVTMTMTESKVDENGVKTDNGQTQVDTNSYKLVPGKEYSKDPTIFVKAGSENAYLFVLVRNDLSVVSLNDTDPSTLSDNTLVVDKANSIEYGYSAAEDAASNLTIADQLISKGWIPYTKASTGIVYVYCEKITETTTGETSEETTQTTTIKPAFSEAGKSYTLFETFRLSGSCEDVLHKYSGAKITLTAVAIQASGIEGETDMEKLNNAWNAVKTEYPYIHTGESTTAQ